MQLKTATLISMVGIALSIVLAGVNRVIGGNGFSYLFEELLTKLSILFFLAYLYKKQN